MNRIKIHILFTFFCCLSFFNVLASGDFVLASPDKKLEFSFSLRNYQPQYDVNYKGQSLIKNSILQLIFSDGNAFENVVLVGKPVSKTVHENYSLVVGKTSVVKEVYNSAVISLSGKYKVNIEVKVFNDGVGFRYFFPKQEKRSFVLLEEKTQFAVQGSPTMTALFLNNYTTSHEGLYSKIPAGTPMKDSLIDMPALFQFSTLYPENPHTSNPVYMGITEAALLDYAGMYLTRENGIVTGILSPLPGQHIEKVKGTFPHVSPWRVMLISDRLGALIESNIITTLSPPLAIKNISWIKPGTTTFPWWNGTIVSDTTFTPGNNFNTNKYYIDFCAANNIKYHTVVEYGGHEWYTNDGTDYQPGKNFDVTKPVDGLDMKAICDYAHSKGVGVRVWVHWKALYPRLDSAFAIFEKWGLSGMMVDFMDRDDQEMVNIQTEILQKAAKHKLHIQFHGAYKPTGLSRTYPNEFTREGTLNYEVDKWNNQVTPDADINIPFTRMLAGSTDYHLGGFRAVSVKNFEARNLKPLVMGTRCHMLGMYVVLENYQGMVCDYPEAYIGQPGFEVLQHIPVTWDETTVTNASLNNYVAIARRKGKQWYLGAIASNRSSDVYVDCKFLGAGKYTATIYKDGDKVEKDANDLKKESILVNRESILKLELAAGGGSIVIFDKSD